MLAPVFTLYENESDTSSKESYTQTIIRYISCDKLRLMFVDFWIDRLCVCSGHLESSKSERAVQKASTVFIPIRLQILFGCVATGMPVETILASTAHDRHIHVSQDLSLSSYIV